MVYDLCHFFALCASQKTHGHARIARRKHMDMRELHAKRILFSHVRVKHVQFSHVRVFSDCRTRAMCKNVLQNLIPRATAYLAYPFWDEEESIQIIYRSRTAHFCSRLHKQIQVRKCARL